jgi:class 3 adenylate cyclase/Tfp pilus assembly protein PilF
MHTIQNIELSIQEWELQAGLGKDLLQLEVEVKNALTLVDQLIDKNTSNMNRIYIIRARLYLLLSETYRQRGFLVESLLFSKEALLEAEKSDDLSRKSQILGAQGTSYRQLGDYIKALQCYEQAILIDEQVGNIRGYARHIGNIGIVYMDLKEYDIALEKYYISIELHNSIGNNYGAANSWGNAGAVYYYQKNFSKALESFTKAHDIHSKEDHEYAVALWLGNIGNVHFEMNNFDDAKRYYDSSSELYKKLNIKEGIAQNHYNVARLFSHEENIEFDFDLAFKEYSLALNMFEELHHATEVYKIHENLASLYTKKGDWERAFIHQRKFHELYVEIQDEDARNQAQKLEHRRKLEEDQKNRELKIAKYQEQEKILHNMLPASIANRILEGETTIAEEVEEVSIFFADIVGFTQLSERLSPEILLHELNTIFTEFDLIAKKYGVEKIKTIGDSYMAVCGVPNPYIDHSDRLAQFALEVLENTQSMILGSSRLNLRIGMHCGKAIAGVIGEHKYAYDLWGDAVNIASRMESHGAQGKIHMSAEFKSKLQNISDYTCVQRGEIDIKGKGKMVTYWLEKCL